MSAPRFTPGPWSVEDPMGFELSIVEADKPTHEWRFIASCQLPEEEEEEPDFGRLEVEANARLIAKAPDLYDLLFEIEDTRGSWLDGDLGKRVRTLLEEVRGAA